MVIHHKPIGKKFMTSHRVLQGSNVLALLHLFYLMDQFLVRKHLLGFRENICTSRSLVKVWMCLSFNTSSTCHHDCTLCIFMIFSGMNCLCLSLFGLIIFCLLLVSLLFYIFVLSLHTLLLRNTITTVSSTFGDYY